MAADPIVPPPAQSLLDRVQRHYNDQPDAAALIFIAPDGSEQVISTRQFFDHAARYANALHSAGVAPRQVVILVMEHNTALLYAFWGALMIDAIPSIFPFLSDKLDSALYFARVKLLVTHSGASAVIASEAFAAQLAVLLADHEAVRVLSEAQLQPTDSDPHFATDIRTDHNADSIAFLQHSSGTTGLQKGVALSHRAVLNQLDSYSAAIRLSSTDKIASWLPLYHDMGLMAGFVLPITQGVPLILMSPFHWVRDPKSLLAAIDRHRATLCWLPNFAYNFMAMRISATAAKTFDLSSMRAFVNCSEPMSADSHRRFAARFPTLNPAALTTCYAMAENTFAVTQGGIDRPVTIDVISRAELNDRQRAEPIAASDSLPETASLEMLSCGTPIAGCTVRIVGEDGSAYPERHIGEVAIQSNSLLSGYYRRDDLSAQAIRDGWYFTGDLGYLANGELFITGRKKDLIIVGGKNLYPHDLEAIAGGVAGVHGGRVVAFGVPDERLGTEEIVIVCEVDSDNPDERAMIEQQIRARVAQQADSSVRDVLLVGARWLIKTSSGKLARAANREKYLRHLITESMS